MNAMLGFAVGMNPQRQFYLILRVEDEISTSYVEIPVSQGQRSGLLHQNLQMRQFVLVFHSPQHVFYFALNIIDLIMTQLFILGVVGDCLGEEWRGIGLGARTPPSQWLILQSCFWRKCFQMLLGDEKILEMSLKRKIVLPFTFLSMCLFIQHKNLQYIYKYAHFKEHCPATAHGSASLLTSSHRQFVGFCFKLWSGKKGWQFFGSNQKIGMFPIWEGLMVGRRLG